MLQNAASRGGKTIAKRRFIGSSSWLCQLVWLTISTRSPADKVPVDTTAA